MSWVVWILLDLLTVCMGFLEIVWFVNVLHGIFNVCVSACLFVGMSVFSQNDRKGLSFSSILLCLSEIVAMCLGFVDILCFVNVCQGFYGFS